MKITNKYRLPQALVNACNNDTYSKGDSDFSVTQLINPPQLEALKAEHGGELVEDVSDRIWALHGSSVHHIIERSAEPGDVVEQRLFAEVDGIKISGQFDMIPAIDRRLTDFKVTSVWSVKDSLENGKQEWADQLNLLAALCDLNQIDIDQKTAQIVAICRDWRQNEALRYDDYPARAVTVPIPLLSPEKRLAFLESRVQLHKNARSGDYPPCTAHEMWERSPTYAVMKEGRKSALRVLDTEQDARKWCFEKNLGSIHQGHFLINEKHRIELRPGSRVRCEQYCPVRDYCQQYKDHLQVR